MKSIRIKILLPVAAMVIIFIGILCIQIVNVRSSLYMVNVMNNKYVATLADADNLKLDVVQVQQWLTDISATRGAKGYDDGFDEAEKYAQNVNATLQELIKINPHKKEELERIGQDFIPYYETGKKMAEAYIGGGPVKGNQTMDEFDKTADAINEEVDSFKIKSQQGITHSINNIKQSVQNSIIMLITSMVIILLLSAVVLILITKTIVNPIKFLDKQLSNLARNGGDLTQQIKISSKDEIGELASGVNRFIENLRLIMIEVNECSDKVTDTSKVAAISLEQLKKHVEDTASTAEELASGMEETTASAEQVNVSTKQMGTFIEKVAEKAQKGSSAAEEISKRADELKDNTITSQNTTNEVYQAAKIKLQAALEQVKAIEQITLLSDSILQISSQTNLLALNAAIEAARAGEAGRGFTIVAEEIGKLAEDSNVTVKEIQKVANEAVASVENLLSSSKTIMEFIDVNVAKDYEDMLKTGEQYSDDAAFVNGIFAEFSATAEGLAASVEEIIKTIDDVARIVDKGSDGTQNITERTIDIVKQVNIAKNEMQISMDSAQKLKDAVGKFVV